MPDIPCIVGKEVTGYFLYKGKEYEKETYFMGNGACRFTGSRLRKGEKYRMESDAVCG